MLNNPFCYSFLLYKKIREKMREKYGHYMLYRHKFYLIL